MFASECGIGMAVGMAVFLVVFIVTVFVMLSWSCTFCKQRNSETNSLCASLDSCCCARTCRCPSCCQTNQPPSPAASSVFSVATPTAVVKRNEATSESSPAGGAVSRSKDQTCVGVIVKQVEIAGIVLTQTQTSEF